MDVNATNCVAQAHTSVQHLDSAGRGRAHRTREHSLVVRVSRLHDLPRAFVANGTCQECLLNLAEIGQRRASASGRIMQPASNRGGAYDLVPRRWPRAAASRARCCSSGDQSRSAAPALRHAPLATDANDFGGYVIPIVGLGVLALTIAIRAGLVED